MYKKWDLKQLPTPKAKKYLPVILSRKEVFEVISSIDNLKHKCIIMFIYATGARLSECVQMRVEDLDFLRDQVKINHGKGARQRIVPMCKTLRHALIEHLRINSPCKYLFESAKGENSPLSPSAVRYICRMAKQNLEHINKEFSPHTFRHCFATHMLELGVNLLVIQRLMGHNDLQSTLRYLHVQELPTNQLLNPLDSLHAIEEPVSNAKQYPAFQFV